MYERALQLIEEAYGVCLAGPVIDIDHISDLMLHTRNCRTLHKYLNQDQFDVKLLEQMMDDYFGQENINKTRAIMENYFGRNITKLRQYFTYLDATVAEHY